MQKILPDGFLYNTESVHVQSGKFLGVVASVRANVTTAADAVKWLDAFEISSNTNFRVMKTWNVKTSKRVVFKVCPSLSMLHDSAVKWKFSFVVIWAYDFLQKKYRCHHDTLAEKSKTKQPHAKHIKCPSRLTITINNTAMKW